MRLCHARETGGSGQRGIAVARCPGCTSGSPQLQTTPSSHGVVTRAPATTNRPALPLWDPAGIPPRGSQVAEKQAEGHAGVRAPSRPCGRLTIRIACEGPGKVAVSDEAGVSTRLSACSGSAEVSAGLPAGRRPLKLGVTAAPTTVWHLGVWVE